MKALIVDDEITCRKIMQRYLKPYGETDTVENGREAVETFVHAIKADRPYDLICLDINMGEMNGLEALEEIRRAEKEQNNSDPGGSRVKVIMITALDDERNVVQSFFSQCDAYLLKPINKKSLVEKLLGFGLIEAQTG